MLLILEERLRLLFPDGENLLIIFSKIFYFISAYFIQFTTFWFTEGLLREEIVLN